MPSPNKNVTINGQVYYDQVTRNSVGQVVSSGHVVVTNSQMLFNEVLTTVSVRTPNFGRLKASQLPMNPYSKYARWYSSPMGSFSQTARVISNGNITTYDYKTNVAWLVGSGIPRDTSLDADNPTQKIIGKLIEKISLAKASTLVTVAELNKTASHLAHTATRVHGALRALKSGRFGAFANSLGITYRSREVVRFNKRFNAARSFDQQSNTYHSSRMSRERGRSRVTDLVADTWLEYSYGWKPLLKDVYDTAKAAASIMVEYQNVVRMEVASASNNRVTYSNVPNGQLGLTTLTDSTDMGRMAIFYRIPSGTISTADAFGLNNPLYVAWELVPFSFVVDWFLPIGDMINALTAFNGLQFHHGWHASRQVIKRKRTVLPGSTYTSGGVEYRCFSSDVKDDLFELGTGRSSISSFPQYGLAKFKNPGSFAHAASAIALLQSLFLRR